MVPIIFNFCNYKRECADDLPIDIIGHDMYSTEIIYIGYRIYHWPILKICITSFPLLVAQPARFYHHWIVITKVFALP